MLVFVKGRPVSTHFVTVDIVGGVCHNTWDGVALMTKFLFVTLFVGVSAGGHAAQLVNPTECSSAIAAVDQTTGLPAGLLRTIAMVESGRPDPATGRYQPWPWTINVGGVGYFYPDKPTAVAAAETFRAGGVSSMDVGCMQINLHYHPDAFASLDQAFEPRLNVEYGARFLSSLFRQSRDWAQAISAYHSQTPAFGLEYLVRVVTRLAVPPPGVDPRSLRQPSPVQQAQSANHTSEFAARLRQNDDDHRRLLASMRFGDAPPRTAHTRSARLVSLP